MTFGEQAFMNTNETCKFVLTAFLAALFLAPLGCSSNARVPENFEALDALPAIYPDYVGTTFPPNIAPANFMVDEEAETYVVTLTGGKGGALSVAGKKAVFPEKEWRALLQANRGDKLGVDVYVKKGGQWFKYKMFENKISDDPVDPYLAYRLIEPGYDYGHRIGLAQRCVESYDEQLFYDNRSTATSPCANCHSFQDHKTDKFLFHYRRTDVPKQGGTIIVSGKEAMKASGNVEAIGVNCTYPSWRSTGDLVAFSANFTRQLFHSLSSQKIEVFDSFSDLVLFDAAKNELKLIEQTNDKFETFPYWSPDGNTLYYSSAHLIPNTPRSPPEERLEEMVKRATELRYNICKRSFDEATRTFGEEEVVVDAAADGRSALFPRISPDGKFLAYTLAESGTFPIWRPEADLYLLNLESGEARAWDEVNSDNSDSYHSWSSSGRWLVFSSRREDGLYTRLYLAHVDEDGNATKPFVLPQKNPEHNRLRYKSYNVPETIIEPIEIDPKKLLRVINEEAVPTKNLE
jgi:Tol biopolymer transport system component